MPTYFDPITLDDLEITATTTMYLIGVNENPHNPGANTYGIKGISSGLQQMPHDPHTHSIKYWPLNTIALLENQHHDQAKSIIFPENRLTTQSLSLLTVKLYLKLDPTRIEAIRFEPTVTNQSQQNAARQREHELLFTFFSGNRYPHNPVPNDRIENRNVRFTNSGTLKILALFLMLPGFSHFAQGNVEVGAILLSGAILAFSGAYFMQQNWTEPVTDLRHAA